MAERRTSPRSHHGLRTAAAILAAAASLARSFPVAAQPYSQTGGLVVIEAESWSSSSGPRNGYEWTLVAAPPAGSSGAAVQALPNNGANVDTDWFANSPELRYDVNFTAAGTHFVWLRGRATTADDDSAHVGLNGSGTGAARITLDTYDAWQWTRTTMNAGADATITVPSTGMHTLNLWMREDGLVADRIVLTTKADFAVRTGNAWHIPNNTEQAGIASMRSPFLDIHAGTDVTIYNGNQFQGAGGDPGNQFQTNSTVFWRKEGSGTWNAAPMAFHSEAGNNKYFAATIPGAALEAGDTIEYYLRIFYDTHLPTYLYGTDAASQKSENETAAQAAPFSFTVQPSLTPSGDFETLTAGAYEARVWRDSGHLAVRWPGLDGTPLGSEIVFAPPAARVNGRTRFAGALLSATPAGGGLNLVQQLGETTIQARLAFAAEGVLRYEVTDWGGAEPDATWLRSASPADEHFYGFGEKFNAFNQAGNVVRMLNLDIAGPKGDGAYKVMPWFVSTRGYGLHFDSSAEVTFDLRKTSEDRVTIANPFRSMAFEVVCGPKLTDVVSRFTGRTGRPPLPPEWAFGVWISSDIWRTGGEVRYLVEKLVERGIPTSVIVFDSPWEVAYNDFTWNRTQFQQGGTYEGTAYEGFESIEDMMSFLRAHGLKAILWMTPFVNVRSNDEGVPGQNLGEAAIYAEAAAKGFFVREAPGGAPLVRTWWKGDGSPIDFTNPAATAWLQQQLTRVIEESRVSTPSGATFPVVGGFKTDDGEAWTPTYPYIPDWAAYFDGRTGVEMKNAYAYEYHKAVWNVLGNDGVLFARSGFTGSQAFPAYWSGDNFPNYGENGLPSVILAGQSAAMCGFSIWSHDVGGYLDGNEFEANRADLFMRWSQFGALTPIMQMHRQISAGQQYPWSYGAQALENYRRCAELHSRLFPYLYSYAKESAETGLPILRPLVLLHQADPNVYAIRHTFQIGNELLLAPFVTANATARTVYLPAGTWYDWWTNAPFAGGQNVNWSSADPFRFPLFVRAGSVVPMLREAPRSLCPPEYVDNSAIGTRQEDYDVRIYPAASFSFALWDGATIDGTHAGTQTTIRLNAAARAMRYRVLGPKPPMVRLNGTALAEAANETALDAMAAGWCQDTALGVTVVKFVHGGGQTVVALGPVSSNEWMVR